MSRYLRVAQFTSAFEFVPFSLSFVRVRTCLRLCTLREAGSFISLNCYGTLTDSAADTAALDTVVDAAAVDIAPLPSISENCAQPETLFIFQVCNTVAVLVLFNKAF